MKRILSLDGGGIRGVFSLMVLKRIEEIFREERGRPDLVLRQEFDFFAGTSTGAIIATFLAWGYSVSEVIELYERQSHEMFAKAGLMEGLLRNKYEAESITEFFKSRFTDRDGSLSLLGTDMLKDGDALKILLVVMQNATTGSAWPVTNNPEAKYSRRTHPECNLNIPVWQLLRASTAAPTFFPPEEILLGKETRICIDGGMTPYNNPALIALLSATLPGYNLNWPTGTDKLQLVSIGTGADRSELPAKEARDLNKLDFATYAAPSLIESTAREQDMICRVLGDCLAGENIDREIFDLRGPGPDLLQPGEKKFTYVRYNTKIRTALDEAGKGIDANAFNLDNLDLIPVLKQRGADFAAKAVKRGHFFAPFERDPTQVQKSKFAQ